MKTVGENKSDNDQGYCEKMSHQRTIPHESPGHLPGEDLENDRCQSFLMQVTNQISQWLGGRTNWRWVQETLTPANRMYILLIKRTFRLLSTFRTSSAIHLKH